MKNYPVGNELMQTARFLSNILLKNLIMEGVCSYGGGVDNLHIEYT